MPQPVSKDRRAAEELKAEGNTLFSKGKYGAAVEKYTEAITMAPDWISLYVNRALCHKKRGDWPRVKADSEHALALDSHSLKANYFLGQVYKADGQHPKAIELFLKALEAGREEDDATKDAIWRELAFSKYTLWQQESKRQAAEQAVLKERLRGLLVKDHAARGQHEGQPPTASLADAISQEDTDMSPRRDDSSAELRSHPLDSVAEPTASLEQELAAVDELFAEVDAKRKPVELGSPYVCPLTMECFRDPAVTPSGLSYERTSLRDHIRKVGPFDPVTRKPMRESDMYPNHGLRAATRQYLDEHPWAWGDIC